MFLLVLLVALLAVPVVELVVIFQVAHVIGGWDTLGLLVLVSLTGAWLAQRAGLGALQRFRASVDAGELPGDAVVDGLLILVGGLLMVVPGFVTGAVGLLLLVPPLRAPVRKLVLRRVRRRVDSTLTVVGLSADGVTATSARWRGRDAAEPGVVDVEGWEVPPRGLPQLPSVARPATPRGHA